MAIAGKVPKSPAAALGIAVGKDAYKAYAELIASPRWLRAFNAGARPQRLLFASTGAKDPALSDVLYVQALAAPLTINTMPENTLKAFADHGRIDAIVDAGGDSATMLAEFRGAGIDADALASKLQAEGETSFVASWNELMKVIASKSAAVAKAS